MSRWTSIASLVAAAAVGGGTGFAASAWLDEDDAGSTTTITSEPAAANASLRAGAGLSVGEIYRRSRSGVVQVTITSATSSPFGRPGTTQAEGSGFVYDGKGRIVTNEHVVDGAESVTVTYADGTTSSAKVLGTDESTDLAVLRASKAPKSGWSPLTLADSSSLWVGDDVVAIGSPFGLAQTVTTGIVSALHREIDAPDGRPIVDAIQTDAAINKGNSGGPLLNADGRVVGVTAQIESDSGGNDGVGFAVPSDTVERIVGTLIADGRVEHALLGVRVTSGSGGVLVSSVEAGSAAAHAGLRAGDLIVRAGGAAVHTPQELRALVDERRPGDRLEIVVRRNGRVVSLSATLGTRA